MRGWVSRTWVWLAAICVMIGAGARTARSETVLVLPFHNNSQYPDLDWVGESVAETLMSEYGEANEIVLDRQSRAEGLRRLSLRPQANYTKGTLIRLGQTLDADYVCYGTYEVTLPAGSSELKDSTVRLSARFLDLRKLHEGPELSETSKLAELSRLEEHLAYTSLKYLEPKSNLTLEQFLTPAKLVRVDAEESYVRGLLSPNGDQRQKWFTQAAGLDPHFAGPAFELGKLALERKEYKQAIAWFQRIDPADPRYLEARFKMGLSAYGAGDYAGAAEDFRQVAKLYPLNEVYNDLGVAESRANQAMAVEDLKRAAQGDSSDPTYRFNLGLTLLKNRRYDEAATELKAAVERNSDDEEAQALLERAQNREAAGKTDATERLKTSFNAIAFRQLKAMLQPKGTEE